MLPITLPARMVLVLLLTHSSILLGARARFEVKTLSPDRRQVLEDSKPITFPRFVNLLESSSHFRAFLISELSTPEAFFFETPRSTGASDEIFEFRKVPAPGLERLRSSRNSFADIRNGRKSLALSFDNPSRTSRLVIPHPAKDDEYYTHLARMMRTAPDDIKHALWQLVAKEMKQAWKDKKPVYLSTHGFGVPHVHVRIEKVPKYYSSPYRSY